MPIDQIITASIANGAVVPADLSTGAPSWDTSGNLSFNSGYGSNGVAYACRAWVNFNGTGTVAIRASGNVTSITDNGTGDYTVNFTTAMPDGNFAGHVFSNFSGGSGSIPVPHQNNGFIQSTTQFRFQISEALNYLTTRDQTFIYVAIFR